MLLLLRDKTCRHPKLLLAMDADVALEGSYASATVIAAFSSLQSPLQDDTAATLPQYM